MLETYQRCSSTMEALRSAPIRSSGAPGWTGATGGGGAPPPSKGAARPTPEPYGSPESYSAEGQTGCGPLRQFPWGSSPPCVRQWRLHLVAPPGQRPGLLPGSDRPSGTALRCRPRPRESKQAVATGSPSPTEPMNLQTKITGLGRGPDYNSTVNYIKIMERKGWMCARESPVTYDAAWGLVRGRRSGLLSMSHAVLTAGMFFPFLGVSASGCAEAALYFFLSSGGGLLSSSSSSSPSLSSGTEE